MKELEITPGKWSVFYGTNGTVVLNEDDEMIVSARNAISGFSEQEANARLIAAAPDLLEALQLALNAMDEMGDILNFHDLAEQSKVDELTPAFEKSRAAISKALGEE